MEWTTVVSTAVERVAYDDAEAALFVEFPSPLGSPQRIFRYSPVQRPFYDRLFADGASIGSLIHGLRRDRTVSCARIDPPNSNDHGSDAAVVA